MRAMAATAIALTAVMVHATAFGAAQTKKQQKCINTLNKGMAKVADAQNKGIGKCVKTRAKDGTTDVITCASINATVTAAQDKNCSLETKQCTEAPEFGKTSCGTVNSRSVFEANNFADDLFGAGVNTGVAVCSTDKAACKCQGKAQKGALKVYGAHLKEYNKCKKTGLKSKTAPFDDAADLTACISSDPANKISKAESKLASGITKKCASVTNPFPGDCTGLNGDALSDCIEARVRCRTCLTETISDGLTFDCDLYDDNTDNDSCFDQS